MIAVTQAPAAPAASAPSANAPPASATPASPFDAILTLEALAATCAALDCAPLGGGALEGGGLEGLEDTAGPDGDDGDDEEHGGPLAFLVNLLNFSAPMAMEVTGESGPAIDDALGSHAQKGGADLATNGGITDSDSSSAAAGKLLLAEAALATSKLDAAGPDTEATQDPTAAIARAAEMLAQAPRAAAPSARDHITTPVHSPRWAEDLGARVALMVRGAESSASLQLTPVDLGPVEVNVTVRDSQATIHFGAAQAETRALLEASIPKLREMLAAQGFNLMDASVSQGFSRQARADLPSLSRGNSAGPELEGSEPVSVTALGLLDMYV